MKRLLIAVCMMMIYGVSFSQTHVVQDNGRSGVAYQIYIGTSSYNLIESDYAGTYSCYTLKVLAGTIWYDYDAVISTWASAGLNYKNNGKTGESNKMVTNEVKIENGILGDGLWIISNSIASGATVQFDCKRLYAD